MALRVGFPAPNSANSSRATAFIMALLAFSSAAPLPLWRTPPSLGPRPLLTPARPPRRRGLLTSMATPAPDRALWANGLGKTYDGERYMFEDIDLIVPVGAKIALLGVCCRARCASLAKCIALFCC